MQSHRLDSNLRTQRRTPYSAGAKGRSQRPRYSRHSAFRAPELDDNLVGFSLAPTWLLPVHEILNRPAEYPPPRGLDISSAMSTASSQSNSPLNTPSATQSQSPKPLGSEMSFSSEIEDRLYWEEEAERWSDEEEQREDLEVVYKSIKY